MRALSKHFPELWLSYWRVSLRAKIDYLENLLGAYVEEGHTTWSKTVVAIDFSDL